MAYLLWFFLGPLGGHRFYLRDFGWGLIFFFTGGLFSVGWFVDGFMLPARVDRENRKLVAQARVAPARLVAGRGFRRVG